MPLTRLEAELRPVARERIATGQLPSEAPSRIWGGPGSGNACALCGKTIGSNEIEYEVEAHVRGVGRLFRFHMMCQSVWELEADR
jgi:hypothetical protein